MSSVVHGAPSLAAAAAHLADESVAQLGQLPVLLPLQRKGGVGNVSKGVNLSFPVSALPGQKDYIIKSRNSMPKRE